MRREKEDDSDVQEIISNLVKGNMSEIQSNLNILGNKYTGTDVQERNHQMLSYDHNKNLQL